MTTLTKNFAAIELQVGETPREAVGRFMQAANELGVKFHVLELFGPMTLGRARLIRFRTDATRLEDIVSKFGKLGHILPSPSGYDACVGGRRGKVLGTIMHEMTRIQKYRGTRDKFWARQFTTEAELGGGLS